MRNAMLALPIALLGLLLLGCPQPQAEIGPSNPIEDKAPETKTPGTAAVYDVACGCSIKEVGHCSEWALVDGKHVELSDLGLGKMPFCGKKGLKAEIAGEVKDGKMAVSSFKLVE